MSTTTLNTATVMALTILARKAVDGEGKSLLQKAAEDTFAHIKEHHPQRVADAEEWLQVIRDDDRKSLVVAEAFDKILSAS